MILQLIRSRIIAAPQAAVILGKSVFLVGAVLILAAVFARAGMVPPSLAWAVPAGTVGYALAAALVLAGMYLVVVATEVIKDGTEKRKANW